MIGELVAKRDKFSGFDEALAGVVFDEHGDMRGVREASGANGEVEGALKDGEFAI